MKGNNFQTTLGCSPILPKSKSYVWGCKGAAHQQKWQNPTDGAISRSADPPEAMEFTPTSSRSGENPRQDADAPGKNRADSQSNERRQILPIRAADGYARIMVGSREPEPRVTKGIPDNADGVGGKSLANWDTNFCRTHKSRLMVTFILVEWSLGSPCAPAESRIDKLDATGNYDAPNSMGFARNRSRGEHVPCWSLSRSARRSVVLERPGPVLQRIQFLAGFLAQKLTNKPLWTPVYSKVVVFLLVKQLLWVKV